MILSDNIVDIDDDDSYISSSCLSPSANKCWGGSQNKSTVVWSHLATHFDSANNASAWYKCLAQLIHEGFPGELCVN